MGSSDNKTQAQSFVERILRDKEVARSLDGITTPEQMRKRIEIHLNGAFVPGVARDIGMYAINTIDWSQAYEDYKARDAVWQTPQQKN